MLPIYIDDLRSVKEKRKMAGKHGTFDDRNHVADAAHTLGKAWKVTSRELEHQHGSTSQKAMEFIDYQMYITSERPVWYEGSDISR